MRGWHRQAVKWPERGRLSPGPTSAQVAACCYHPAEKNWQCQVVKWSVVGNQAFPTFVLESAQFCLCKRGENRWDRILSEIELHGLHAAVRGVPIYTPASPQVLVTIITQPTAHSRRWHCWALIGHVQVLMYSITPPADASANLVSVIQQWRSKRTGISFRMQTRSWHVALSVDTVLMFIDAKKHHSFSS